MEYTNPLHKGEKNNFQMYGLKIDGENVDSERCESAELNEDIRRQIQQKNMFHKAEEAFLVSRTETLYQRNFCHHGMLTQCFIQSRNQNNMSTEAYKEMIQKLEKQRAELLDVNKQWDNQFRNMKQAYEKKVGELRMKLSLYECSREGCKDLKKDDSRHNWKDQHTQQGLVKATQKTKDDKAQTRINIPARDLDYADMRADIAALLQQIKIYEEDFRQERADKEKLRQEKEELQQTNRHLCLQIKKINKLRQ
ncbi:TNFAIP3-interacting protein 3 [Rana temporaria]|uniref:TNFAIP3-interacting protein 3 n=1 Tax=Rana temporaria TaxID=8407 RepID=UPI001AADF2F3|nr:TNFAIP3-interacting protein 3 [Rana temporaria]